jgi:mevalonate pyrophosphate decarboxylase
VKKPVKSWAISSEGLGEVEKLLVEVRGLLAGQQQKEDGLRLAFCLQEIAWESGAAISYYHSRRFQLVKRNRAATGPKGGGGGSSGGGAAAAAAAAQVEESEAEEEEEEEEEEEGVTGKRGAGGEGVNEASKRRRE